MKRSSVLLSGILFLTLAGGPAFAENTQHGASGHNNHGQHSSHHGVEAGDLTIGEAWTRATVKTAKVGAGFVTIKNKGDQPDRLIGAEVNFAKQVQIHEMKLVEDVMRMRPLPDGVEIPAGGEVTLKPGAEHVMFMGLKEQLVEGTKVQATLKFEKAGDVPVTFYVNSLAAKNVHDGHGHHGENHQGHGGHSN